MLINLIEFLCPNFTGECHGKVVHLEDSDTEEQCLELCKSTSGNCYYDIGSTTYFKTFFNKKN